ncbi:RAB11-binding protein RELCH-like [Rhincodon typus]|uniref:RAB11-binding protein RELCH-like n=1 Tax=Rhincodon typus TaxID=259920 RepID=UPI00202F9798|nr:RAB11-binding protein RELCH-like [Rhincodon typus]
MYREYGSHATSSKEMKDVAVEVEPGDLEVLPSVQEPATLQHLQLEEQTKVVQELRDQLHILKNEKITLTMQIRQLKSEIEELKRQSFAAVATTTDSTVHPPAMTEQVPENQTVDSGEYLDIRSFERNSCSEEKEVSTSCPIDTITNPSRPSATSVTVTTLTTKNKKETEPAIVCSQSAHEPVQFDKPNRTLSPAFHQALLSFCRMATDSRLGAEVSRIADSEQCVMLMLGRCLPHIVPNVLLAKREKMVIHLCQVS